MKKVLQSTEQHIVPQLYLKQFDLLRSTLKKLKKVEMCSVFSNTSYLTQKLGPEAAFNSVYRNRNRN